MGNGRDPDGRRGKAEVGSSKKKKKSAHERDMLCHSLTEREVMIEFGGECGPRRRRSLSEPGFRDPLGNSEKRKANAAASKAQGRVKDYGRDGVPKKKKSNEGRERLSHSLSQHDVIEFGGESGPRRSHSRSKSTGRDRSRRSDKKETDGEVRDDFTIGSIRHKDSQKQQVVVKFGGESGPRRSHSHSKSVASEMKSVQPKKSRDGASQSTRRNGDDATQSTRRNRDDATQSTRKNRDDASKSTKKYRDDASRSTRKHRDSKRDNKKNYSDSSGDDDKEDESSYEQEEVQREDLNNVSFLRKGFNQNIVAGIVAFTGPGLFNAMQGLGNAGGSDPSVAATMNATLYATFSIFGVLSGSLFNLLGTKILMSFGAVTYAFYAISVYLWGQVDESYAGLAIFSAAVLGIGAACLWGAQGTMTLSYALENQKGLFFGLFWLIFNMGGVMGGFISMGINMAPDEERATSVTPETYFTFCSLMIAGSVFAFIFVLKPSRVVKADGTVVKFEQTEATGGLGELKEVAKLFGNRYMLLLTPLIIQSNWFYAYEFGGINGLLFDAPTRGLNSAFYWAISGVSSYIGGTYYLDKESVGGRRQRAVQGLVMISAINVGQWIYALIYQFSTGYDKGNAPDPPINFSDGGAFFAPFLLFMYCGLADSLVQTYAYWIIGSISNNPRELSMYVGYYKGVQSFGAALSWIIEANGTSYRAQLVICSCLAVLFIPPTFLVATCVKDKGSMTAAPESENAVIT